MLIWADNLRVSENIKDKTKIIKAINKDKTTLSIYCVTFSTNPSNLFDIYNANEFKFPYYKKQKLFIVGLAKGKEEAVLLTKDLLLEVYNSTGDFKVREYFANSETKNS